MPPIDPSIIMGLKQFTPQDPLESYSKVLGLKTLMGQQELQGLQTQQARQGVADDQATRDAYTEAQGDPTRVRAILAGKGQYKQVQALDKLLLENKGKQSEIDLRNSQIPEHQQKAITDATVNHRDQLVNVNDPQSAAAWVQAGFNDPLLAPVLSRAGTVQDAIAKIPTDPAAFQQWKQQNALGATKFIEMNAPKINVQGLGDKSQIVATPGLGGQSTVVSSSPMAQSPDSVARTADALASRQQADRHFQASQQGSDIALSPEAIKNAAARYNIDGTLPPMGLGKAGAQMRKDVLNEAAVQAGASGATPDEQRITQIGNKANTASLTKLQTQQNMVGAFERNFNKNADIALEYSTRTDKTGIPIINKWINSGKRAVTGDPDLSAYDAIIKSTVNEYAKVISGSMGNTPMAEGEIKKVESLLTAAQTPEQVQAVLTMMKRETANRMKGFDEERAALKSSMAGRTNQNAAPVGAPIKIKGDDGYNALPKGAHYVGPDGVPRIK